MKTNRLFRCLCLWMILVSIAQGREPLLPSPSSQAETSVNVLWTSPETIQIPLKETPSEKEITLPSVQTSKSVYMRFRARFNWTSAGGMCAFFQLELNGHTLGPENATLVNRGPFEFNTAGTANLPTFWVMRDRTPRLFIQYAPDWDTVDPKLLSSLDEGHWYVLDVSPVIEPGRENLLVLKNLADLTVWPKGAPSKDGIIVDGLSLVTPL